MHQQKAQIDHCTAAAHASIVIFVLKFIIFKLNEA